jgi:hypothetical protein
MPVSCAECHFKLIHVAISSCGIIALSLLSIPNIKRCAGSAYLTTLQDILEDCEISNEGTNIYGLGEVVTFNLYTGTVNNS